VDRIHDQPSPSASFRQRAISSSIRIGRVQVLFGTTPLPASR
jgi:hypothetical protein